MSAQPSNGTSPESLRSKDTLYVYSCPHCGDITKLPLRVRDNHSIMCGNPACGRTFRPGEVRSLDVPSTPASLGTKPSNPKDIVGSDKVPLHLWPMTATMLGSLALMDGALKYGRANWRHAGVRASIYYDAAMRHLAAWFEGEDIAQDSKVDHLGHALACIAIVVDARAAGKLVDDRQTPGGFHDALALLNQTVPALKALHKDRPEPKHYTIQDDPTHV